MSENMTLRSAMRTAVPFPVWQTLGFLTRIPSYWRVDRSEALRIRNRTPGLPLYVSNRLKVFPPESITAYLNWQHHGIEFNESSIEAKEFLDLSSSRSALIDIGAQTGFMSALFARSRTRPSRILSVEPDPQVLPLLQRAIALNTDDHIDWTLAATALSDISGKMVMPVSNRLHEQAAKVPRVADIEVQVATLSDLLETIDWQPDIIKIDVESFEHEILCSSLGVLDRMKPALQLEIHWQMLRDREKNPFDFLSALDAMGYRGIRSTYRNIDKWRRASRSEAVSRLSLSAT
ncbi:MAG TPA: FkbM family methyltransferase [Hyphomicrobium sp.]|nr:FkbM family methyltransferase [Rhizomicrobium sp.]HVX35778.1 FkbM family methyltransferase [Hyphomicrobium sp.]